MENQTGLNQMVVTNAFLPDQIFEVTRKIWHSQGKYKVLNRNINSISKIFT
jgi:hypothetical protein